MRGKANQRLCPQANCFSLWPMIPVDSAEVEQREIVLGVQGECPLVGFLASVNITDPFLCDGDLKPAQGARLMKVCLLQQKWQRFIKPLEGIKSGTETITIAVRVQHKRLPVLDF